MKAIVHIGTEKTGTSSIQKFLKSNADELKSRRVGVLKSTGKYNDTNLSTCCAIDGRVQSHHMISKIIKGSDSQDFLSKKKDFEETLMKRMKKEVSSLEGRVDAIVFSSELFHSQVRDDEEKEKLRLLLESIFDEIQIVVYLRPQVDVCCAHYSTELKYGSTRTLCDKLKECNSQNYYYNYNEMLKSWERVFGRDNISVRAFAKDWLIDGDLVEDFSKILGVKTEGMKTKFNLNESLTPTGQNLIRVVNSKLRLDIQKRKDLVNVIMDNFSGSGELPCLAQAKIYQDNFYLGNCEVAERYFNDDLSPLLIDEIKYSKDRFPDLKLVGFFSSVLEIV